MGMEYNLYLDSLKNELIGDLFKNKLNEERGVNKDYLPLANEIYDALLKYGVNRYIGDGYVYALRNYKPKTDTFIDSLTVSCFINISGIESSFSFKHEVPHLTKSMKINNIAINISVKNDENNIKIPDKNDFIFNFCHEFHHAYRYYNIINKNNGSLSGSEQILKDRNKSIKNVELNYKFDHESVFDYFYKAFLEYAYHANNDEINAFSSEVYEFLRQNPDFDKNSILTDLNKIPSYEAVESLRDSIVFIDTISKKNDEYGIYHIASAAAQSICNDVLKFGNVNRNHALLVLRQFFAKAYEKQERQFFKVLKKALNDLGNKNIREEKNMIKNIFISKEMAELLNRGRAL